MSLVGFRGNHQGTGRPRSFGVMALHQTDIKDGLKIFFAEVK